MTETSQRHTRLLLLLIALVGCAVLAPGLGGPFLLDDFASVAANPSFQTDSWGLREIEQAVLTNTSGPFGRPVSMLTFVANAMTTGLDPGPMKATNAALHGVTAILLGMLLLRLFAAAPMGLDRRQATIAALGAAACWAFHPLAVTSTLYVVQRMNLLATLFTIAALLAYLKARPWIFRSPPRAAVWLLAAAVLWVLGVLSKENALLAPLYALLIEWLIFRFRDDQGRDAPRWRKFVLGSAAAGLALVVVAVAVDWRHWSGGFENRGFTMGERLLTEARVIWHYVGMILLPGHSRLGLFLDDIPLSRGLLQPATTLVALAGLGIWTGSAVLLRRRAPIIALGLLLFLAGHLLESTFIALEIAFEHRNYLPSTGLLMALAGAVALLAKRLESSLLEWLPLTVFAVFLAFFTVIRSAQWSDIYLLSQLEAFHHPNSARAQSQLGFVYAQFAQRAHEQGAEGWTSFYMDAAAEHLQKSVDADPDIRSPLFTWLLYAHKLDQPFPQAAYVELLERLHSGLPTNDTPANLLEIYECVVQDCGVPPEDLETLLRVTLENPRFGGRVRSETLVVAAKYFRSVRKDPTSAALLLRQAAAASPRNPRFHLFLARQLFAMGHLDAAAASASKAAELDEWNVLDDELAELRKLMEEAKRSQSEVTRVTEDPVRHSAGEK